MDLVEAYQQSKDELTKNVKQIDAMISSYQEIQDIVTALPSKVEHEVFVPFAGSNRVLMRGIITDTNKLFSQLGETVFVARTAANTANTLKSRVHMATSIKADFNKQINEIDTRTNYASAGLPSEPFEAPKVSDTHDGAPGLIRKTPEGFLEIVETLPPDKNEPLIQEVPKPKPKMKKSKFAEEFSSSKK
eukprot:Blabericola_migrator_1__5649@NODE_286_length_10380_cov_74_401920_g236_i0_p5_GENE_NODE_286_length_10380_cov_74_401920_g236_i0NODE_286_length_10380_cov_74_401920_g236_i0_p5_ORF_typecomplete_len190_score53_23Prefoldin/PF02996_17/1_9e12FliD_N/PF02465_18/0_02FliD_N/PF02465_18/1_1e03Prefoldin_2/PF01920_20/0_16Adhesin_P1_N/PF18652_1/9_9e02Adhesin_P1_N/PF18652_1/0_21Sec34/PF04136_15/1_4_NODE_286_length_10380_cov_74_401920_g236_i085959164